MKITKEIRRQIFDKFNGRCAYSGTSLEDDWQIDHIKPVIRDLKSNKISLSENDKLDNMFPCQKLINHYKHSYSLEDFRYFVSNIHNRLKLLPKNPRTEKSKKRIIYMNTIANYFGITEEKPFSGTFYFETLE